MNIEDDGLGLAIGNLGESMIDFRGSSRVKGIRVEIQRAGLERRLENIGHVGEKDVVKEIAKLGVVDISQFEVNWLSLDVRDNIQVFEQCLLRRDSPSTHCRDTS